MVAEVWDERTRKGGRRVRCIKPEDMNTHRKLSKTLQIIVNGPHVSERRGNADRLLETRMSMLIALVICWETRRVTQNIPRPYPDTL